MTAVEILEYARDYQGAAAALRDQEPSFANRLEAAASTLLAGRALAVERAAATHLTTQEALRMAETIEQVQAEVRQNFVALEAEIRSVRDPAQRAAFLRDLAGLKAEAAPMLREDLELQGYRTETAHPDYRGLPKVAGDARAAAIKAEADGQVGRLAERVGLQPEAALARYAGESVSLGLGRDYRAEELAERAADRAARGAPAERVDVSMALIAAFHHQVEAIYRDAAERMRKLERRDARGQAEAGMARDAGVGDRGGPDKKARSRAADLGRTAGAAPRADEPEMDRANPPRPSPRRRERDDDDRSR